jgi:hypothetical protein
MPLNVNLVAGPVLEPITLLQAKAQARVDPTFTLDDPLFEIYIPAARQLAEKVMRRAIFNQTWVRTLDNFPLAASFDISVSPADRWNWPVYGGMWNRLAIDLPLGNVVRIISITYQNVSGQTVTLPASYYSADLSSVPCRLVPADAAACGLVWPFQGTYLPGSVQITYEAASFVRQVSESFSAPAGPYTYQLAKAPVTGVQSVTDASGDPVAFTVKNSLASSVLTLPGAQAGPLTVKYSVASCPSHIQLVLLQLVAHYYRNPEATSDLSLNRVPFNVEDLLSSHIIEWTDYRPC